jgi:hypothetical protein
MLFCFVRMFGPDNVILLVIGPVNVFLCGWNCDCFSMWLVMSMFIFLVGHVNVFRVEGSLNLICVVGL